MCGRCEAACPVDLKLNALRLSQRTDYTHITKSTYDYIQPQPALPAKVAYFAGCMGHLTPSVIQAMEHIFRKAGVDYTFIDQQTGICCGRPMMLAGNHRFGDRGKKQSPDRELRGRITGHFLPDLLQDFPGRIPIEPKGHAPHRIPERPDSE